MNPILTSSGCGGANFNLPEVQTFEFNFFFYQLVKGQGIFILVLTCNEVFEDIKKILL